MPVSSTLTTSAPRSANNSVQKPPGRRRVRSSTRSPLSGSDTRLHSKQAPGFIARRRTTPGVLTHLPRLGDQVTVRAPHLAVRQVEVVLEPDPDRPAKGQSRGDEHPLLARDPDHAPV